ncbi:hypothetical protein D3C77_227060 [compost metagenome]
MTVDKEKLKALAEIMLRDIDGCLADSEACDFQQHAADYEALTQPGGVLALLEEIEQLRESHEQVCANYNRVSFASEERGKQVEQLKAENDALRSLVLSALEEGKGRPGTGGNAPGHCHGVPGVWDRGNGDRSGTACGWCKIWNAAQAMARGASHG